MRIQFVCLPLLVLSAALLSAALLSKHVSIKSRYDKFKKQHIYKEMTANMCDEVMRERKINPIKTKKCKKINTFIKADEQTVRSICVSEGEPYGAMTKSRQGFDVVVCIRKTKKGIMRIPFACLLLFSATVLSQDASITPRYRKFIEQHVNGRMSENRCDSVIGSRRISKTNSNECKETNTFIQATTNHIKAICEQAGEPYGDMTKSLQPFPIIVCTLKNQQGRLPNCQYRGQARTRRIAIRCEQGFPVHFERDIIHFEN
ncbi:Ribonuclease-like 3 [Collichthys lucidus]|uniref:Ribonuclease-like 3 n=1 Tax=Collichthys lucidus TaxID=240159 RepID=A0A4U5UDJ0_COLLU|nr:Ribonuclease-like 3 [Collichthys lucidus]